MKIKMVLSQHTLRKKVGLVKRNIKLGDVFKESSAVLSTSCNSTDPHCSIYKMCPYLTRIGDTWSLVGNGNIASNLLSVAVSHG
jgi:hypothetical protein